MHHLNIKFIKPDTYSRFHVTGIWGGLTPDGQKLDIELFEDAPAIPENLTMTIDENNKIVAQEVHQLEHNIDRYVYAGITIPISEIPSIIEWLNGKYEEYLRTRSNSVN